MSLTDDVRSLLGRLEFYLRRHVCTAPSGKVATELHAEITAMLAAQPEPQGVELEVVGTLRYFMDYPESPKNAPGYLVHSFNPASWDHTGQEVGEHHLVRLTDAQHLLSTERAEAERKMAELREERDILQGKLDRFYSQSHGIPALSEIEKLRARVAELESRQVVMPPQCVDRAMPTQYRCGWNSCLAAVARLNQPQANSQEEEA